MNLNLLSIFVDLVKTQSFSKTGFLHNISRTSVARKITELEEQVGKTLLINTTREIELTDLGRTLYNNVQYNIESLENNISKLLSKLLDPQNFSGKIHVQLPISFSLNELCRGMFFRDRYPNLEIHITFSNATPDFNNKTLDAAIVGNLLDKFNNFNTRYIASRERNLYCSQKYIDLYGKPEKPNDLFMHRYAQQVIHDGYNNLDEYELLEFTNNYTQEMEVVNIKSNLITDSPTHNLVMAQNGLCIAALVEYPDFNSEHNLIRLFPDYSLPKVNLHAITRKNIKSKLVLDDLISYVIELVSGAD